MYSSIVIMIVRDSMLGDENDVGRGWWCSEPLVLERVKYTTTNLYHGAKILEIKYLSDTSYYNNLLATSNTQSDIIY